MDNISHYLVDHQDPRQVVPFPGSSSALATRSICTASLDEMDEMNRIFWDRDSSDSWRVFCQV